MLISVRFFKFNRDSIASVLLAIFNAVMETAHVPDTWKLEYITPISKKGAINIIGNYRGIAMQSVIPKMFDKLLTSKLYHHLHGTIPKTQHGFMPKRSTQTNLLDITQFLHERTKAGDAVDVLYFDFTKAFDQVDHGLLAVKLVAMSLPPSEKKTILTKQFHFLPEDTMQGQDTFFFMMQNILL